MFGLCLSLLYCLCTVLVRIVCVLYLSVLLLRAFRLDINISHVISGFTPRDFYGSISVSVCVALVFHNAYLYYRSADYPTNIFASCENLPNLMVV